MQRIAKACSVVKVFSLFLGQSPQSGAGINDMVATKIGTQGHTM